MNDLLSKIKSLSFLSKIHQVSFEKKGAMPARDWGILVIFSLFLMMILGVMAFYFYTGVNNGTFFTASYEESSTGVKINNSLLNKVIGGINEREKKLTEIKGGKRIPINPAI